MTNAVNTESVVERGHVYGLLSTVFRRPLDAGGLERIRAPEMLAALGTAGLELGPDFALMTSADLLEALAIEYTHIFHSPGHVAPFESIIADGGDELRGDAFAKVRHFMGDIGFEVTPESGEMADHISVELAFMAELCVRQAESEATTDKDGADFTACMQDKFLAQHLGKWTTSFARAVEKRSTLPFYAEMAAFLADFVDGERETKAA